MIIKDMRDVWEKTEKLRKLKFVGLFTACRFFKTTSERGPLQTPTFPRHPLSIIYNQIVIPLLSFLIFLSMKVHLFKNIDGKKRPLYSFTCKDTQITYIFINTLTWCCSCSAISISPNFFVCLLWPLSSGYVFPCAVSTSIALKPSLSQLFSCWWVRSMLIVKVRHVDTFSQICYDSCDEARKAFQTDISLAEPRKIGLIFRLLGCMHTESTHVDLDSCLFFCSALRCSNLKRSVFLQEICSGYCRCSFDWSSFFLQFLLVLKRIFVSVFSVFPFPTVRRTFHLSYSLYKTSFRC